LLGFFVPSADDRVCCETREDKKMRRVLKALAVLCSLVLVMTACGEGGDQQVASESTKTTGATKTTKKLPGPGEPLSPGTEYVTTEFQPAFSFRVVDEGWEFVGPEFPDLVDITRSETYLTINFVNPRKSTIRRDQVRKS
jgi:hypothetical protein